MRAYPTKIFTSGQQQDFKARNEKKRLFGRRFSNPLAWAETN
jgi:hypothetical protein